MLLATWTAQLTRGAPRRRVELHEEKGKFRVAVDGRTTPHEVEGDDLLFTVHGVTCIAGKDPNGWELTVDGELAPKVTATATARGDEGEAKRRERNLWIAVAIVALGLIVWRTRGTLWQKVPAWAPKWRAVAAEDGRLRGVLPGAPVVDVQTIGAGPNALELHRQRARVPEAAIFSLAQATLPGGAREWSDDAATEFCAATIDASVASLHADVDVTTSATVEARASSVDNNVVECSASGHFRRKKRLADAFHRDDLGKSEVSFRVRVSVTGDRVVVAEALVGATFAAHPDVTHFLNAIETSASPPPSPSEVQ